jgi:hypothetical protein
MPSIAEAPFQRIRCRFLTDPLVETLIYVRPYNLGQEEEKNRTLSVVGLPVLHHPLETVLEGLFSACEPVERVAVHPGQARHMILALLSNHGGGVHAKPETFVSGIAARFGSLI